MRFKQIIIENYRQYKKADIDFDRKDLSIFIGIMGIGKTNLLNAISWCLYEDEPFLSNDQEQKQLPRLNLGVIDNSNRDEEHCVSVTVVAEIERSKYITFTREERFRVQGEGLLPESIEGSKLEVSVPDWRGHSLFSGEEAESYVDRFIPANIKRYFFFDGENLDRYFKEETGDEIRRAIIEISQVSLLDSIKDRLESVITQLNRSAGKDDPKVDEYRKAIEEQKEKMKEIESQRNRCSAAAKAADKKVEGLLEKLYSKPDARKITEEIESLEKQQKDKQELLDEKELNKQNIIVKYSIFLNLYSALESFCKYVEDNKKRNVFPATNDKKLLESILEQKRCICERPLLEGSNEYRAICKLLEKISYSSEVLLELSEISGAADSHLTKVVDFKNEMKLITDDIRVLLEDIEEIEAKLEKNKNSLSGHKVEQIRNWQDELEEQKELSKNNHTRHGQYEEKQAAIERKISELERKLDKEISKDEKLKTLQSQRGFTKNALSIVIESKEAILEEIRAKIAQATNDNFFSLMWKTESYREVTISNNYDINIINSRGFNSIGTLSGGEREVLALSFTLALQTVSGFDAPIIIDRPLAMVSGPPRRSIAEILVDLAEKKQIILLLTPDDYKDVSDVLETGTSKTWKLKLASDELSVEV